MLEGHFKTSTHPFATGPDLTTSICMLLRTSQDIRCAQSSKPWTMWFQSEAEQTNHPNSQVEKATTRQKNDLVKFNSKSKSVSSVMLFWTWFLLLISQQRNQSENSIQHQTGTKSHSLQDIYQAPHRLSLNQSASQCCMALVTVDALPVTQMYAAMKRRHSRCSGQTNQLYPFHHTEGAPGLQVNNS